MDEGGLAGSLSVGESANSRARDRFDVASGRQAGVKLESRFQATFEESGAGELGDADRLAKYSCAPASGLYAGSAERYRGRLSRPLLWTLGFLRSRLCTSSRSYSNTAIGGLVGLEELRENKRA